MAASKANPASGEIHLGKVFTDMSVATPLEPAAVDTAYYQRLLRGATAWLVLGLLLGALAALGSSMVLAKNFAATTTVRVTTTTPSAPIDIVAEAAAAMDPAVLASAGAEMSPRRSGSDLSSQVSTEGVDGSALINITVESKTASGAVEASKEVAQAFLRYRGTVAIASRERALTVIRDQIAALQRATASAGSADEIIALRQERASLLLLDPSPGYVVKVPSKGSVDGPVARPLLMAIGAIVGGVAGVAFCGLRNLLSRRTRDDSDVRAMFPTVPVVQVRKRKRSAQAEAVNRAARTLSTLTLPSRAEQRTATDSAILGLVVNEGGVVGDRPARLMGTALASHGVPGQTLVLDTELTPEVVRSARAMVAEMDPEDALSLLLLGDSSDASIASALDIADAVVIVVNVDTTKKRLREIMTLASQLGVERIGVLSLGHVKQLR